MWWSNRGGENKEQERIEALEKAQERLESSMRLFRTEWESTYDKLNRLMGRLNARIRKSEAETAPESDTEALTEAPGPRRITGSHATLSQARARRRGVLPG